MVIFLVLKQSPSQGSLGIEFLVGFEVQKDLKMGIEFLVGLGSSKGFEEE